MALLNDILHGRPCILSIIRVRSDLQYSRLSGCITPQTTP